MCHFMNSKPGNTNEDFFIINCQILTMLNLFTFNSNIVVLLLK